jgi:hypothetical protein
MTDGGGTLIPVSAAGTAAVSVEPGVVDAVAPAAAFAVVSFEPAAAPFFPASPPEDPQAANAKNNIPSPALIPLPPNPLKGEVMTFLLNLKDKIFM